MLHSYCKLDQLSCTVAELMSVRIDVAFLELLCNDLWILVEVDSCVLGIRWEGVDGGSA